MLPQIAIPCNFEDGCDNNLDNSIYRLRVVWDDIPDCRALKVGGGQPLSVLVLDRSLGRYKGCHISLAPSGGGRGGSKWQKVTMEVWSGLEI